MNLERDLDRGQRAERLLQDPMLNEAFSLVETAIHQAWASAPIRDREGQHELKLQLKLLGDVRANLEQALQDGKLAASELKRINTSISPAQWQKVMHGT